MGSDVTLTSRELDVMEVLWDAGSATVSEVQESLADDLAYTTVLTVLRVLEQKGHVRHEEEGRAHRYLPLVDRTEVRSSALNQLIGRVFAGSPEALLTQLVSDEGLSSNTAERIRAMLDERLNGPVVGPVGPGGRIGDPLNEDNDEHLGDAEGEGP